MDVGPASSYCPRLDAKGTDQLRAREAQVVGDSQAAQLIVFILVMTGLLLALEVGLRRAHRP